MASLSRLRSVQQIIRGAKRDVGINCRCNNLKLAVLLSASGHVETPSAALVEWARPENKALINVPVVDDVVDVVRLGGCCGSENKALINMPVVDDVVDVVRLGGCCAWAVAV